MDYQVRLRKYSKISKSFEYRHATKFEITRIVASRSFQLAQDPKKPFLGELQLETDVQNLALLELLSGRCPFFIDDGKDKWEVCPIEDDDYINFKE
jgi:DNA-directed RNA polymerase subunit K/omega